MKRAERQPTTDLTLYAGIYLKQWMVPDRGTLLPQHAHDFDHISFVVSGVVRIWAGDELLGDYAGPRAVKIAAGVFHRFLTLSDGVTIACIHNADRAEGDPPIAAEYQMTLED
jgi:quercetin dioxygenase-like cupin family protein